MTQNTIRGYATLLVKIKIKIGTQTKIKIKINKWICATKFDAEYDPWLCHLLVIPSIHGRWLWLCEQHGLTLTLTHTLTLTLWGMFQPTFCNTGLLGNTIFWTWYTVFLLGFDFICNYVWLCKVWTNIRMGDQWWCECQSVVVSAFYLQTLRNVAQPSVGGSGYQGTGWGPGSLVSTLPCQSGTPWVSTLVTRVTPWLEGPRLQCQSLWDIPGCRTMSNSAHHHYQDTLLVDSWCLQFEGRKDAI